MNVIAQAALAEGIFVAFTAGSCKGNPGPGGAAIRVHAPNGVITEMSRKSLSTTNNIAEMSAVIEALKAIPEGASVLVCLSCNYIKDNFEMRLAGWQAAGWKKTDGKDVANKEQWQMMVALSETRQVSFHKINPRENKLVASLAKKRAEAADRKAFRAARDAA